MEGIGLDVEIIEQDTTDSEEITDILRFITNGIDQRNVLNLSLNYNKAAFDGWVRQPSPCCAAASVAGCFNALMNLHRSNFHSMNHQKIVDCYCHVLADKIYRSAASFERRLGAPIGDLFKSIDVELLRKGRAIGGKKTAGASKAAVIAALKQLARVFVKNTSNDPQSFIEPTSISSVVELFRLDGIYFGPDETDDVTNDLIGEGTEPNRLENEEEKDEIDEELEDEPVVEGKLPIKKKGASASSIRKWDWKKDIITIVQNMAGLRKLMQEKPSTASIGNWGILEVTTLLAEFGGLGCSLRCRLFMGKRRLSKQKLDVALQRADSDETVRAQWDALRSALARSDTALLFHLTNHYAVIFALREWTVYPTSTPATHPDGLSSASPSAQYVGDKYSSGHAQPTTPTTVRQLLCARRGQRPAAWLNFNEAREIMLGWEGYKIMALTYSPEGRASLATPQLSNFCGTEAASGITEMTEMTEMTGVTGVVGDESAVDSRENLDIGPAGLTATLEPPLLPRLSPRSLSPEALSAAATTAITAASLAEVSVSGGKSRRKAEVCGILPPTAAALLQENIACVFESEAFLKVRELINLPR